jgi:hypothetical protein
VGHSFTFLRQKSSGILAERSQGKIAGAGFLACYPELVKRLTQFLALAAAAVAVLGASALLPARVEQVAREVEKVRGRRFERPVPASEIDSRELRRVLRSKVVESFPASPEETLRTLAVLGLIEETPGLLDRLVDFYASQVIAFYDPEPRRFYVVKGAENELEKSEKKTAGGEEADLDLPGLSGGMAEKLIFAHELTHALQDQTLKLDRRMKDLKDNGDRALALESLLEGEATLVMVRVVLTNIPGAGEDTEEMLAPLLSAGSLERAGVPKDIPDYFADQLFFPYAEGTAYVRRVLKAKGWNGMDRLWKSPPQSTSEILHDGAAFTPVEGLLPVRAEKLSPPGARFLYSDTLGEWTIRFLLRRTLEETEADPAAAGWRGDRIAFFSSGRTISYLWRIRFESPEAAERFEAAWKKARKKKESFLRNGGDILIASGLPSLPDLPGFPSKS